MGLQALLFAGLLAFSRSHVDDDRFFAPVAGVVLGLLLFMRFDAVLAWAGVGLDGGPPAVPAAAGRASGSSSRWRRRWPPLAVYIWTVMQPGFGRFARVLREPAPDPPRVHRRRRPRRVGLLVLSRNRRLAGAVTTWTPPLVSAVVVGRGRLRLLLPRAGGTAGAARRAVAPDVHVVLPVRPAWSRRSPASCCSRGSGSGAIRRCCWSPRSTASSCSTRSRSCRCTSGWRGGSCP